MNNLGKPEGKKVMNEAMKGLTSFVFYMIADFALIAGIVLILFGAGEFLSSMIGIPGAGNIALGFLLFLLGAIVLSRAKARIQFNMQQPGPPMEAQGKPPEPPDPGTYR